MIFLSLSDSAIYLKSAYDIRECPMNWKDGNLASHCKQWAQVHLPCELEL